MRADLSTLGVESVGGGRVILHGRSRWLFLALAAVVLLITLQSARIGVAGLIVEMAQSEVDRWNFTQARRSLRDVNRVAGFFSDSLGILPGNPRALEGLGALGLTRVRLARTPREAVAYTRDARLQFRRAMQERPTSPFLWANLARSKLLLDEVDAEFFRALRIADALGPWEPATQRSLVFLGLAVWEKLDPELQQAMVRSVGRGARHDAPKMYEIVKSYRRFDLVCGIQEYNLIAGKDCRPDEKKGDKPGERTIRGRR